MTKAVSNKIGNPEISRPSFGDIRANILAISV